MLHCREALQALVSPTDAQLALCSAGAYGEKQGEGPLRDVLPAQIELEKLSKRWNVPTGTLLYPHVSYCTHSYLAVPTGTLLYPHVPYCTHMYLTVPTITLLYPQALNCIHRYPEMYPQVAFHSCLTAKDGHFR